VHIECRLSMALGHFRDMMIDVAIHLERNQNRKAKEAIACVRGTAWGSLAGTRPATNFGVRVPQREAATDGGSQDDGLHGERP
jgi:hypothetical protein